MRLVVFLAVSLLSVNAAAASEPVQIIVSAHENDSRLALLEERFQHLDLHPNKSISRSPSLSVRYFIPRFDPASDQYKRLDYFLKALWGDDFTIRHGADAGPPPAPAPAETEASKPLAAAAKTISRFSDQAAAARLRPGATYDNASPREAAETSAVTAQGSKNPPPPSAPTPPVKGLKTTAPPSPVTTLPQGLEELPFASAVIPAVDKSKEQEGVTIPPLIIVALLEAKGGFKDGKPLKDGNVLLIDGATARRLGVKGNVRETSTSIMAGTLLLAQHLATFDGDIDRALAAYEMGRGAVSAHGKIPKNRAVKELLDKFHLALSRRAQEAGEESPEKGIFVDKALIERRKEELAALKAIKADPWQPYLPMIAQAVEKYNQEIGKFRFADAQLVEAMLRKENGPADPELTSDAGAVGLVQLMPGTARRYHVNRRDPAQSIDGGVHYFWDILSQPYINGDVVLGIAAYNAGEDDVRLWLESRKRKKQKPSIPNYAETKHHVRIIFTNYNKKTGQNVDYESLMP